MQSALYELLRQCTVRISVPDKQGHGTGFFVAPELILTCAHVIKPALKQEQVKVFWNNQSHTARVVKSLPELDIALLSLSLPEHPCVYVQDSVEPFDKLYSYGYSDMYVDGEPASFLLEGKAGEQGDQREHLKLKTGQVRPGLSGAPLLNMRTGYVCGIIQKSRDRESDLGGRAIPISTVFTALPELEQQQRKYHQEHAQWTQLLKTDPSASLTKHEQQDRRQMLKRVKRIWVKGVLLEPSLYRTALLELSLQEDPAMVENPWHLSVQETNLPTRLLAEGTPIVQVFDEADGQLLILGKPGAGKTTLLLDLARQLLDRAEQDDAHPIPVVLNLSSWAKRCLPLADWLVEELFSNYKVSRHIGRRWVEGDQLLLLLDGLDEVAPFARQACLTAINDYHQKHWLTPIVVCSRSEEYMQLSKLLKLQSAVTIQPLTKQQVEDYLSRGGESLTALCEVLQEDRVLEEMVETPLMLAVMMLAYANCSPDDLPSEGSVSERRRKIFDAYVTRVLKRRSASPYYRDKEQQVRRWLAWLARQLDQHQQTDLYLERMQPDWIPDPKYRQLYMPTVCVRAAFIAIFIQVLALLGTAPLWTGVALPQDAKVAAPLGGVLVGIVAFFSAAVFGEEIKPVELLTWTWSWKKMWQDFRSFKTSKWYRVFALLLIGISGLGAASTGKTPLESGKLDLAALLTASLLLLLGPRLMFAIEGGWGVGQLENKDLIRPNEGIKRSARNGRRIGLCYFLGIVAFVVFLSIPAGLLVGNLIATMRLGMTLGIIVGLGAATEKWLTEGHLATIQQSTLFGFLRRAGAIPLHYQHFLDYASERILLQKVGGGYRFIHRFLQEYFLTIVPETFTTQRAIEQRPSLQARQSSPSRPKSRRNRRKRKIKR